MMDLESAKSTLGDEFSFLCDVVRGQLSRLGLATDARILDVGTGKGRLAITLALSGYEVLTGEPAEDESEYAKQAWRSDAQQVGALDAITYQAFNAEQMPFDSGSFDAIFMMGALHHMGRPAAAVAECIRVMAPGGVICILEPNARLLELARARFPNHPDPEDPRPHVEGMSLEHIRIEHTPTEMFDVYLISGIDS